MVIAVHGVAFVGAEGGAGLDILLMRSRFDEILMLGHNQGSRLKEKAKIYLFGLP